MQRVYHHSPGMISIDLPEPPMTCRHQPGDPNCSSHPDNVQIRLREQQAARAAEAKTPDADRYEIVDVHRVGSHLVLKVQFPNCSRCSFEGNKVLVFLNAAEADVLRWKRIDPHFRSSEAVRHFSEAPSPAARFPASDEGWKDAVDYAALKAGRT